jgi:hypothetical protein
VAFTNQQSAPPGWTATHTDTYTWAKPFFGEDSTWLRFQFLSTGSGPLSSSSAVIGDVINTSDLRSFSTYGIEACYRFHGYRLYTVQTIDLGNGVAGNSLTYLNSQTHSDWTTVYWHWPVVTAGGKTRYERMTLMMLNSGTLKYPDTRGTAVARSLGLGVQNALSGSNTTDQRLARAQAFLIAFARSLIAQHAVTSTQPSPHVRPAP